MREMRKAVWDEKREEKWAIRRAGEIETRTKTREEKFTFYRETATEVKLGGGVEHYRPSYGNDGRGRLNPRTSVVEVGCKGAR